MNRIYYSTFLLLLSLLLLCLTACEPGSYQQKAGTTRFVATTSILADAVKNIVGDSAVAISIMGPGVDPHLYKPTQGDLRRLTRSTMVIYNGLHLEGKMGEVLEKLSRLKPIVAAADGIPKEKLRQAAEFQDSYDPHIWFDVALWKDAVQHISKQIQQQDPDNAAYYQKRTERYVQQLDSLDNWVQAQIQTIPQKQRILITAHDAFGYFGDAYQVQVRGLQGISTMSEFGLRDVSELVDFIVTNNIKAVFVETSVSEKSIKAVVSGCRSKGHEVKIGGTLYSDALGAKKSEAGTYIGMVRSNVNTIVSALK
ncbi:MAG: zinc ABC transporter substrate-binding protein [Hymenobacteraceae bacterium]|nr:zinc ABC transporter substrate-binding protein [Hymenobacteraceae bacterium]MDX5397148.1 zinc ABC transporter substrate-binding protein [Hymenobacteraceae bacterium]MDX5513226.1 zinc ABC transporter substrate-binding protein [Hymenobacteraceae bacterium]